MAAVHWTARAPGARRGPERARPRLYRGPRGGAKRTAGGRGRCRGPSPVRRSPYMTMPDLLQRALGSHIVDFGATSRARRAMCSGITPRIQFEGLLLPLCSPSPIQVMKSNAINRQAPRQPSSPGTQPMPTISARLRYNTYFSPLTGVFPRYFAACPLPQTSKPCGKLRHGWYPPAPTRGIVGHGWYPRAALQQAFRGMLGIRDRHTKRWGSSEVSRAGGVIWVRRAMRSAGEW